MPASTLDPVNAALRMALSSKGTSTNTSGGSGANGSSGAFDGGLEFQIAGSTKKALLANIDFEPAVSYQNTVLDKLKTKYIVLKATESPPPSSKNNSNNALTPYHPHSCKASVTTLMTKVSHSTSAATSDSTTADSSSTNSSTVSLAPPRRELYPLQAVQLGWNTSTTTAADWTVGAGMVNMGNTCYLNSTLQALFHVPALVNWLVSDKEHMSGCDDFGSCIVCAMCKTLQESQKRDTPTVRPHLIVNKLRLLSRNFLPGRQEDAHEFLRYLVEAMEKSFLNRFKHLGQLDARTKETTPLNQILGGYLRSAVRCLQCSHISTTFQHFQDLLLDIRKAQTLDEALDLYFSREKLDDESYFCEACHKKVHATKQFSLERAPMVLCIQLKRFSVTNNKISKHLQFRQRLDLTRYSRTTPQRSTTPLVYRLVAMVTHMGPAVSCGHYTAVAQTPCGNFYQFDDSMVRPISQQAVFNTNAYIMFYELESAPFANSGANGPAHRASCTVTSGALLKQQQNGYTSSKPYGPELPSTMNGALTNGVNKKPAIIVASDAGKVSAAAPVSTVTLPSKTAANASMPLLNGCAKLQPTALGDKANTGNTISTLNTSSNSKNHIIVRPIAITPTKKTPLTAAPANNPTPLRQQTKPTQPPTPTPPPTTSNGKLSLQVLQSKQAPTKSSSNGSRAGGTLKLVPYEDDDEEDEELEDEDGGEVEEDEDETSGLSSSSGSSKGSTPERPTVGTKATSGDWHVVGQTADVTPARLEYSTSERVPNPHNKPPTKSAYNSSHPGVSYPHLPTSTNTANTSTTTTDLLRMGGHSGYGQPVATWSGGRSTLDRQVAQERRDERKRGAENELDSQMDAGRAKVARKNSDGGGAGVSAMWSKSNPGYNPIQEFHNAKNWNKQTGSYNRSFYSGNKHRNNNRRNFHQKNGYHNKNRYRP